MFYFLLVISMDKSRTEPLCAVQNRGVSEESPREGDSEGMR